MTEIIKPFDAGKWFAIHNDVFDVIMPTLSPNAWKVLCVAIRQTWGWVADANGDPKERKASDIISYSQFLEKTGIGSYTTLSKAIQECLNQGYLLRREVGQNRGSKKKSFAYRLNMDFEITTTESVAVTTTESVAVTTTESVDTKQTNRQTSVGVVQQQAKTTLFSFGGFTESEAEQYAYQYPELVQPLIDYIESSAGKSLQNPIGWLKSRLQQGEGPPKSKSKKPNRKRYIEGKYADFIEH